MVPNRPLRLLLGAVLALAVGVPAEAQRAFEDPDRHVNRTFHLDYRVSGPDGQDYRVRGDVHVALHARLDRSGTPVEVTGRANTNGISVNQLRGPRSYRAVGVAPIDHATERTRQRASNLRTRLEYGLISPNNAPNYRLVLFLRGHISPQGALMVHLDDVRLLPR